MVITLTPKEKKEIIRIHGENFKESDIPALWRKRKEERLRAMAEDERETCEKCGGEIKVILLGDESLDKCVDCGWINEKIVKQTNEDAVENQGKQEKIEEREKEKREEH